jgi:hypothetical protein
LVYTVDPLVWGAKPWDFAAIAAFNLKMHDRSIELGEKAAELDPLDLRLQTNVKFYKAALSVVNQ